MISDNDYRVSNEMTRMSIESLKDIIEEEPDLYSEKDIKAEYVTEQDDLPHIVWVSHNPMGAGGFQVVSRNLLSRLEGWKKSVIALEQGNILIPYSYGGCDIYETSTVCGIRHYLSELQPDVIVVYGAFWHMSQYLEAVKRSEDFIQVLYVVIENPPIPKKHHADMGKFEMIMTPSVASAESIVDIGYDAYLVHHGVDHQIFQPRLKDNDTFLFGVVKVNNFKAQIGRVLYSYNTVCRDMNSKLLIHANPLDTRGAPLKDMVQTYNMDDYVRFSQPAICQLGLPDDKMAQMYKSLDVFLSASGGDSVNLPALEAAACGVPSILADTPGPQEYLGDSATYIPSADIYPSGFGQIHLANTDKLAEAIKSYYDDESLRTRKAKLALEYSKQWPWERAVDELQKNLDELM